MRGISSLLIIILKKVKYAVIVTSSAAEQQAYVSTERDLIVTIVSAINNVIVDNHNKS